MTSATAPRDKNGYQASAWHFAALIAGNVALALGVGRVTQQTTGWAVSRMDCT